MENNYCFNRYDEKKDFIKTLIDKEMQSVEDELRKARDLRDLSPYDIERFAALLNELKCQDCESTDVTITLNRIDGKFKGVMQCRKCGEIKELEPCTITNFTVEEVGFCGGMKDLKSHNTFSWYGQYR